MEKVKLTRENGISIVTLNRPESYNALDMETLEQLLEQLKAVKENDDRILIFTGEGKAFCAGGDITMMQKMDDPSAFDYLMDVVADIALQLYLMPKLVISAINGSAAGLGLSFALNVDYIVANKDARFGMLFAGIGLVPDGGGHFFLQDRLGTHGAKQFIWSMEQVAGDAAKEYGFVDVMTEGDAIDAAKGLGAKLLASPTVALIGSKLILHEQNVDELRQVLDEEKKAQLKMRGTKDHAEGAKAFLQKRKPNFIGK